MFEASLTANEIDTVSPRERLDFFRKGRIAVRNDGAALAASYRTRTKNLREVKPAVASKPNRHPAARGKPKKIVSGKDPALATKQDEVLILKGAIIRALVARVAVRLDKVEISICPSMLWHVNKPDLDLRRFVGQPTAPVEVVSVPACVRRTGMETRLLIDGAPLGQRDPGRSLLRLLGQARRFSDMIIENPGMPVADLAEKASVSQSYFTRVFRLSFLATEITTAILHGRQPPELTANKLMQTGALRPFWPDQHRQLGFK